MGFIEKTDVARLLTDDDLIEEFGKAILEDPEAVENLAGEFADALSDRLSADPKIRGTIVAAALTNDEFRRDVAERLAKDLS